MARRIAEAHGESAEVPQPTFVCGWFADEPAAPKASVALNVLFPDLPSEAGLARACACAGATRWRRRASAQGEGRLAASCHLDGVDFQLDYIDQAALDHELDDESCAVPAGAQRHDLADALLKAEPLSGHAELARLQARLTRLPPKLACAMVKRFLSTPTPWRAISQMRDRGAVPWCRELQVDACYRLCAVRAALSQRYFTRFQVKRSRGRAPRFEDAPGGLGERIERLMELRPRDGFAQLFALEGEVLAQVAREMPQIDLTAVRAQRAAYAPALA